MWFRTLASYGIELEDGKERRTSVDARALLEESAAHVQRDAEQRAHRVAYSSLKHNFEKAGDHWEEKDEKGPSDPEAQEKGDPKKHGEKETYGGVEVYGNTKEELYERAKDLDVEGRSKMNKKELAKAISRKQ